MNKKLTMYHPIYHAIYKMWIGRSSYFGEKNPYPTIQCIFIPSIARYKTTKFIQYLCDGFY